MMPRWSARLNRFLVQLFLNHGNNTVLEMIITVSENRRACILQGPETKGNGSLSALGINMEESSSLYREINTGQQIMVGG